MSFFHTFPLLYVVLGSGDLTHKTVLSQLQQGRYQLSVFFNRVGVDLDEDPKEEPCSHQASQRNQCIEYRDTSVLFHGMPHASPTCGQEACSKRSYLCR